MGFDMNIRYSKVNDTTIKEIKEIEIPKQKLLETIKAKKRAIKSLQTELNNLENILKELK